MFYMYVHVHTHTMLSICFKFDTAADVKCGVAMSKTSVGTEKLILFRLSQKHFSSLELHSLLLTLVLFALILRHSCLILDRMSLILQAPPYLHPLVLEGLVRTKTFSTVLLGVAYSVSKSESSSSLEVRNYDHHRWEPNKQMRETNTPCVSFDIFLFYHWERCNFLPVHILQVSFGHCKPLAASQVTRRKDMEVLHKFAQP